MLKRNACLERAARVLSQESMYSEKNGGPRAGRPKVLWLMQYAPHYRESLLEALSEHCDLTVSATPCSEHMLIEPIERKGYKYHEGRGLPSLRKLGSWWLPWEYGLIWKNCWDVIFCVEDMHYPLRYLMYLRWLLIINRRPKWVWWGHFAGRRDWLVLKLIRRFLVNSSDGALTYTEECRRSLIEFGCKSEKVVSANNSEVTEKDICPLPFPPIRKVLNVLFVGRYLMHKQVERLIDLAERLPFVRVRLIGPSMTSLRRIIEARGLESKVKVSDAKIGDALREDFLWCHLVASPGHLGLLVISSGKYGRCVVVDSESQHAPEEFIARLGGQPFINWLNNVEVDDFIHKAYKGELPLKEWGLRLSEHVRAHYTIEKSVERFTSFF